jgi:hypothetical protein
MIKITKDGTIIISKEDIRKHPASNFKRIPISVFNTDVS